MARAISYVRFSTPKQALGDSRRRQLERTRKYCEKRGLTLDETLIDDGFSGRGAHIQHGHMGLLLVKIADGQVPRGTYLILEHLDRFSRQNPLIAVRNLIVIIQAGIIVVTLFDEHEYSETSKTIADDLTTAIRYMDVAHKESERKGDLIRELWDGKREAVASGERKSITNVRPAWLDVANGAFKRNRKGVAIVRRVFELVASGMSTYAVCQLLNKGDKDANGVYHPVRALTRLRKDGTPIGTGWNTARISEIIKSDAPLGWFQPHKRDGNKRVPIGEPIKDYYPAVVKQELADRARYMLTTRSFKHDGGRSGECVTNLFSRIARCALCGEPMYLYGHGNIGGRGRRKRRSEGYLRCSKQKRNKGCENTGSIPYAKFEHFVVDLIVGFAIPDKADEPDHAMQDLIERLADAKADADKTYVSVVRSMEFERTPLIERRIKELEASHAKLSSEITELERQIEIEKGKTKPADELAVLQRILSSLHSAEPEVRLMTRTRVAAGLKRIVRHFLCFPNRGVIGEYDLGSGDSVMCVIRAWLTPDGKYEVYNTDLDFGHRKGKTWLSFIDAKLHRIDNGVTSLIEDWRGLATDYNPESKGSSDNWLNLVEDRAESASKIAFNSLTNVPLPSIKTQKRVVKHIDKLNE